MKTVAECYTNTTVNIATEVGFFSRMCSLQSLEMPESEHHLTTALSVESWPGALQTTQKHFRGWRNGLEAYGLPVNAILGGISNGQPMWEPLSITHGDGRSIQP